MTSNLGMPVAVDAAVIEQELTSLWKSEGENERGAIRACSCNLVVIAHDRAESELLPELLARVAEWHPCRSLIAYQEEEETQGEAPAGDSGMRAWIRAHCLVSTAGGSPTCCETVTVGARGSSVADLPNILVSLLVPDLPVFLYWRSFKPEDQELAVKVADFADLLIVDSHVSKDDAHNRGRFLTLLTHAPKGLGVRDLNWSRLTAWRDLITQFFDPPALRRYAREICEVEIVRSVASPANIPTRTLLLTGWLASRLNWQRTSAERQDGQWISRWNGPSGEVVVRFSGIAHRAQPGSGYRFDRSAREERSHLHGKSGKGFLLHNGPNRRARPGAGSLGDRGSPGRGTASHPRAFTFRPGSRFQPGAGRSPRPRTKLHVARGAISPRQEKTLGTMNRPSVQIFSDIDTLARAAAEEIARALETALRRTG